MEIITRAIMLLLPASTKDMPDDAVANREQSLDEALSQSFPASDPPSFVMSAIDI